MSTLKNYTDIKGNLEELEKLLLIGISWNSQGY